MQPTSPPEGSARRSMNSPVQSYNEWDPLEEVIVGTIEGVTVPVLTHEMKALVRSEYWDFFRAHGGQQYPPHLVEKAAKALDRLQQVLEGEGVTVVRPEAVDYGEKLVQTPYFSSAGFFNADVRDVLMVVGDELIEAPMSQRCRAFESLRYKSILQNYFERGARWTAAPKPRLWDALYDWDYPEEDLAHSGQSESPENLATVQVRFMINESEPCFDAADFTRFGTDILAQQSHVTNRLGIEWLARHLGPDFNVRTVKFQDPSPLHMDATLVPIGEGRALLHPDRPIQSPEISAMFQRNGWEFFTPPPGVADAIFHLSTRWLSMNLLVLDPERVLVESSEEPTIRFLKNIGVKPIPVDFKDHYIFGGGLHCATLDVRRRGTLKRYFD